MAEPDPPAGLPLAPEHGRDDEPGDHEEDVDADEAAGDRQPGVVGHDEQHRDGAKALDVPAPGSVGDRHAR